MGPAPRLTGASSRFVRADGPRHPWTTGEVTVDLPVIVDWVHTDPTTGDEAVRINARVDLVDGEPQIVQMSLVAPAGRILRCSSASFAGPRP
jgi:hypothetical protein